MEVKRYACNLCKSILRSDEENNILDGLPLCIQFGLGRRVTIASGADRGVAHICVECLVDIGEIAKKHTTASCNSPWTGRCEKCGADHETKHCLAEVIAKAVKP